MIIGSGRYSTIYVSVFNDKVGIVNKMVRVIIGSGRYSTIYIAY